MAHALTRADRGAGAPGPRIFADAASLAEAVAADVAAALAAAIATRGEAGLMLCGGRSPVDGYGRLASRESSTPDWRRVTLFFTDERAVPPDDPESNFRLVHEVLAGPAGIPARNLRRMEAESPDLDAAAERYESLLPDALDVVVLGLGEDGHVASLFPGSRLLDETRRRVAVVRDAPKPPSRRLTVTPRVLAEARRVLILAIGAAKADAVAKTFAGAGDPTRVPARPFRDREWYLDAAAAGRSLDPRPPGTGGWTPPGR